MAVKKQGLVTDNNVPSDLGMLAYYLDTSKAYLLTPAELIKWCKAIVVLLSKVPIPKEPSDQVIFYMQVLQVEDYLKKMLIDIDSNSRVNLLFSLFKQMYDIISKATPNTCPAISIVLNLLDSPVRNIAVRIFLKQGPGADDGSRSNMDIEKEISLRTALITLCRWLCFWEGTPSLHEWIISFMRGLQEASKYDLLIDVSSAVISDLFESLQNPSVRTVAIRVFLHILASTRDSIEMFDKFADQVPIVLESLASDTSAESRSVLQNLVEAFTALLDAHPIHREQYNEIVNCLDSHMKSKGYIMNVPIWKRAFMVSELSNKQVNKVGLVNLGNTCYMNSALQALFMTKQFSNQVVLSDLNFPLICNMKTLFAHMMFSQIPCLNPQEIYNFSKPTNFPRGTQQDTSEFISYYLDKLHELEVYARSIKATTVTKKDEPEPSTSNKEEEVEKPVDESTSTKGETKEESDEECSSEKRRCVRDDVVASTSVCNETIVQEVFAGSINTSTRCSKCDFVSSKKDAFWDLQLAFPEGKDSDNFSIAQLMDYYLSTEKLQGDNQYHCQSCQSLQDAERFVSIDAAPRNLIVVLKQFFYDPKRRLRAKLFHQVKLNKHITLTEGTTVIKYEMYAVIVHSGTNLDNGHYYTIARDNPQDWYILNDSQVQYCSEQMAYSLSGCSTPYIVFYKRLDPNPKLIKMDDGESDFNICEETIPFSFLPVYLVNQVKITYMKHSGRRQSRRKRSLSTSITVCCPVDEETPSSSNAA